MMSEFFVKLIISKIHQANLHIELKEAFFFQILVTLAVEKIREHIVKEAELEGQRRENLENQRLAGVNNEVTI